MDGWTNERTVRPARSRWNDENDVDQGRGGDKRGGWRAVTGAALSRCSALVVYVYPGRTHVAGCWKMPIARVHRPLVAIDDSQ